MPVVALESKGPVAASDLPDVLDPDVINTGEVNLMVEPVEAPPSELELDRADGIGSVSVHVLFILFVLLQPELFPYRPPTQEQIDLARQQLNFIYMPPDVRGLRRAQSPRRAPAMRIDPRLLRQGGADAACCHARAQSARAAAGSARYAARGASRAARCARADAAELPAPAGIASAARTHARAANTSAKSNAASDQWSYPAAHDLARARSATGRPGGARRWQFAQFGGPIPRGGGFGGGNGGGGGRGNGGGVGGGLTMLTPTEGVDFSGYLARVVASVKRIGYSVMPESARLGDKGRVIWRFRIMRDGGVPDDEPALMGTSGKDPLDRAASSSIRTSSPFEPLPSPFTGPTSS